MTCGRFHIGPVVHVTPVANGELYPAAAYQRCESCRAALTPAERFDYWRMHLTFSRLKLLVCRAIVDDAKGRLGR